MPPAIAAKLRHQKQHQINLENSKKRLELMSRLTPTQTIGMPLQTPWPMFVQKNYFKGKGDPMTKGQRKHTKTAHTSHQSHQIVSTTLG